MANYTFFGRVHPERASLNIGGPVNIKEQTPDGEDLFELVIHIYANQIVVRAITSDELNIDLSTMRNLVTEHVHSVVNLASFVFQSGYEVEIISVINHDVDDDAHTFGIDLEIINDDVDLRSERFSNFLPAIGHSQYVRLALSDFKSALNTPEDTGVFCYRAFESILRDFKHCDDAEKKKKYALSLMGEDLNIGSVVTLKSYLGKRAGYRRHGEAVYISWEDRKEVMKRVWILIDRYLEYLKLNRTPLSKKEFPKPNFTNL